MGARNDKPFDAAAFFSSVGLERRIVEAEPEQFFFNQGDEADSVFCLLTGRAKISVVSANGKQATILFLSPGDYFGEESLATPPGARAATVTAVNRCAALKIKREESRSKLTDGGEESQCGWLKDKYGISWQIVPTILKKLLSDPDKADKVTKAFLQMKKFDIERLMQA